MILYCSSPRIKINFQLGRGEKEEKEKKKLNPKEGSNFFKIGQKKFYINTKLQNNIVEINSNMSVIHKL